nr:hypothetical protein [Tanacetum cinerariifolium]
EEIFPIVNQVEARVQNFKIQFLKEAAKFVGDFKSLANEADASLAKHKALELEIERLLKAVITGSESRPPMLNKENYVPWSSCLLRYAKSRPNGKLIHNYILNGPYVRRMIPEPGDVNRDSNVTETFHLQTDDELSDKEIKEIEADDQAI